MEIDVSLWGATGIPGPPQTSSMAISGVGALLPFRKERSLSSSDLFVCSLGMAQGDLSGHLRPSDQLNCNCSISPIGVTFGQIDSWTLLVPLGCPEVTSHG